MKAKDNLRKLLIACLFSFLLSLSSLPASEIYYDVSYLWTKNLQSAKAYASKVRKVLGPKAAVHIKVVRSRSNCYGVIYDRNGSYQTALRLARHHAQLLHQVGVAKKGGVSAASPIRDRGYWLLQSVRTQSKSHKLDRSVDSRLEADIDRYIKRLRQRGKLLKTDRTSFVVYDISMQKKLVSINEDQPIMAASFIKNFIMLAYFHQVKCNRLQHTNRNRTHLRQMIQKSSNSSTNYFIRLLGGPRNVTRILAKNYSYFDRTKIVEYIPTGGRTYRNVTSAHDLNRFFNQLWLGKLPYSEKMKYYLGLPNRDRIYTGTRIPRGVRVYNKTGTIYGMIGDSGILVIKYPKGRQKVYAFTGIIEDKTKTNFRNRSQSFSSWASVRCNFLRRISEIAYDYIYEIHDGNMRAYIFRPSGLSVALMSKLSA